VAKVSEKSLQGSQRRVSNSDGFTAKSRSEKKKRKKTRKKKEKEKTQSGVSRNFHASLKSPHKYTEDIQLLAESLWREPRVPKRKEGSYFMGAEREHTCLERTPARAINPIKKSVDYYPLRRPTKKKKDQQSKRCSSADFQKKKGKKLKQGRGHAQRSGGKVHGKQT